MLHDVADERVTSRHHPRGRPNRIARFALHGSRFSPRFRNAIRPSLRGCSATDPCADLVHRGQGVADGPNVSDEDGVVPKGLLHELDLIAVVFLPVRDHKVGLKMEDGVDVHGFGAANARNAPEGGFGSDAELGLAHDVHLQVVEEFCPAGNQRNNAHDAKVVRYLCVMNVPVRFAVVGCGHIGKRHAAMVLGHDEARLVAVVDVAWEGSQSEGVITSPDWAKDAQAFSSLTEALKQMDVDVVSVCTPNGTHVELATNAVAAGCHVILEKPMGLRSQGVAELKRSAEKAGVTVFGVMQNRYAPAAQWLKQTQVAGGFGEVLQVHVQCLWNRDERYYAPGSWRGTLAQDGGPLFTQFSHFLDILMWVFGEVVVQDAHFVNQTHQSTTEFEDGGVVRFVLAQRGWGTFTFSTSSPHRNFESSMTVMGSAGTVRIGGQYMDRLDEFALAGVAEPDMGQAPPPNDYGGYTGSAANHHHVYQNVLDVLLRGAEVATPIQEGLAVVSAIEEMNRLGRA